MTPLPQIGKGKGKISKTQQSEILTAAPLKEIFEQKVRKRKEKVQLTKIKYTRMKTI